MHSTQGILWKTKIGDKFYKASTFGYEQGFIGHEAINEVIVSHFLSLIDIPHIEYTLEEMKISTDYGTFTTYVSVSQDFKKGRSTMHYEDFEDAEKPIGMQSIDFLKMIGQSEYVYQMFFVDYCIINRDRHGANIDLFSSSEFVPLYDNGLSFVAPCLNNESAVAKFIPMKDYKVNNYIGSRSLKENLLSIPKGILALKRMDMKDMHSFIWQLPISSVHCDMIWRILKGRWEYATALCNPKLL